MVRARLRGPLYRQVGTVPTPDLSAALLAPASRSVFPAWSPLQAGETTTGFKKMRGAIPLCCWKSPRCCALVEACYWRRSFWKSAAEAPAAGWLAGWMDGWRPLGSAGKSLDERPRVEVVVLLTSEHTREEPVCQQTSGLWWSQEKLSCTWHCLTREGDSYLHRSR